MTTSPSTEQAHIPQPVQPAYLHAIPVTYPTPAEQQAAYDALTHARTQKEAAYADYLDAHRQRRALGESRAALTDPRQDTSRQDAALTEANAHFRSLIRDTYHRRILRPADLQDAAGISRQRLHQILRSLT